MNVRQHYQGNPNDRHTTAASLSVNQSSHTVPHSPNLYTSKRPSYSVSPSTSRIEVSENARTFLDFLENYIYFFFFSLSKVMYKDVC